KTLHPMGASAGRARIMGLDRNLDRRDVPGLLLAEGACGTPVNNADRQVPEQFDHPWPSEFVDLPGGLLANTAQVIDITEQRI
ncbi:MAG: hypothetical protein AAGC83_14580, partial [Pseudomonadota bacterium]